MIEKTVKVKNPAGLHLRPAGDLCQKAMEYESHILLCFRNREFNAKSLLSVLSACVQQDDELILRCSGKDEADAADALIRLIEGQEEK